MTTPKTGAPEWAASQASPHATVNEALRRIEGGAGFYVVADKDLTAPPGSCADGAVYIVAAAPTGAWSGQAKAVAQAVGTNAANGWYFRTPEEGVFAWVQDENLLYYYDGSGWSAYAAPTVSDPELVALAGLTSAADKIPYFTGSGTAGLLTRDTDGTLAANSDSKIATQKAVKTYVDAAVAGAPFVLGFVLNTGATGTNVGPTLIAPRAGSFSKCKVVVKASDPSTDLTFTIKKNGTAIFSSSQTITHGASAGAITTITALTSVPLSVAADDLFTLDITSGTSTWQVTVQLEP